ncbi:Bifunctional protein HldE [subsurface metagenome]
MSKWQQLRIMIVGDVSLSRTVYVRQSQPLLHSHTWRTSYEFDDDRDSSTFCADRPGSTAKIAAHISSFGAEALLYGVTGSDEEGECLKRLLESYHISTKNLVIDEVQPTVVRNRVYSTEPISELPIFRFDRLQRAPLSGVVLEKLSKSIENDISRVNCVIVADFGISCVTPDLLHFLGKLAKRQNIPLVVYPTRVPSKYRAVPMAHRPTTTALCPNWEEALFLAKSISDEIGQPKEGDLEDVCRSIIERFPYFKVFVIRRRNEGIAVIERDERFPRIANIFTLGACPVDPALCSNPTGRGTVFTGSFALSLAGGFTCLEASTFANYVAGLQSKKRAEEIIMGEEILSHLTIGSTPVLGWAYKGMVGDTESQKIRDIVKSLVEKGGIYLSEAVSVFPSHPEFLPIITAAPKSDQLISSISDIMKKRSPLQNVLFLIYGDSRSGKTQLARSLHGFLQREGELEVVHCNADTLSEVTRRIDSLEKGDTLLLDEIGEQRAARLRGGLLHVLDKLKDSKDDIVIIATTSTHPKEFKRKDIFKRFRGPYEIPSLKQSKENIPYLVAALSQRWNNEHEEPQIYSISEGTLRILLSHDYPNNLGDLDHFVKYALERATEGSVQIEHLPPELTKLSHEKEDGIDINFVF